jgi:hypothetical protein
MTIYYYICQALCFVDNFCFFLKDQCKSPTNQQINQLEEEGDLRDKFRSELSPEYANEIITLSSSSNEEMTVLTK